MNSPGYPNRARSLTVLLTACLVLHLSTIAASPGNDLTRQAKRLAARYHKQMGKEYVAQIDNHRHLVYISALDAEHLRQTQNLLAAYVDAHKKTLFVTPLPWNVVIILPTTDDFRDLVAEAGYDDCKGFYVTYTRKLISIDRGSVLIHEFTHALHEADFTKARQTHPIWIKEGLATLFDASRITPSGLEPYVDTRLLTVQKALREKNAIDLDRLLKMGRKPFMKDANICYAQSRYLMLYLYQKNRLRSWYADYKKNYTKDPTGRKALKRALGKPLHLFEPEWKQWVQKLKPVRGADRAGEARLGLEVKADKRGVKVVRMLPGSAAKTAGRIRVGDIITKLNGVETKNIAAFVAAVRSAGANQTVKVELIRHGRKKSVIQPLGAPKKEKSK